MFTLYARLSEDLFVDVPSRNLVTLFSDEIVVKVDNRLGLIFRSIQYIFMY